MDRTFFVMNKLYKPTFYDWFIFVSAFLYNLLFSLCLFFIYGVPVFLILVNYLVSFSCGCMFYIICRYFVLTKRKSSAPADDK